MVDIAKCQGGNDNGECAIRQKCYRYMAEPHPKWQSYMQCPMREPSLGCDHYWPIKQPQVKSGD